jgi:sugar phosphate isomerase/epimerase
MLKRREFIKASTAAAAVGMLSPLVAMSENPEKIKTVGFQVWSIAKFLEQDLDGNLDLISRISYKELELYGPYPFSSDKDKEGWKAVTSMLPFSQSGYFGRTAKEFKSLLDSKGLRTPAMHVGLDTLRHKLEETAEAAHVLGQQYAGIAALPEEERRTMDDYKRIADDFNSIGEKAKRLDIRFYYHNHGYGLQPVDGVVPFDIILERTDPALVFFEMDIFWTVAGGADPLKYLDAHPGRFKLMHIKDMKEKVKFSGDGGDPRQWVELFPYITDAGSGVLDLPAILSSAQRSGLEHFIVENDVITDPKASLEKSYKYVSEAELK